MKNGHFATLNPYKEIAIKSLPLNLYDEIEFNLAVPGIAL
jgi:hypothetical protein